MTSSLCIPFITPNVRFTVSFILCSPLITEIFQPGQKRRSFRVAKNETQGLFEHAHSLSADQAPQSECVGDVWLMWDNVSVAADKLAPFSVRLSLRLLPWLYVGLAAFRASGATSPCPCTFALRGPSLRKLPVSVAPLTGARPPGRPATLMKLLNEAERGHLCSRRQWPRLPLAWIEEVAFGSKLHRFHPCQSLNKAFSEWWMGAEGHHTQTEPPLWPPWGARKWLTAKQIKKKEKHKMKRA